MLLFMKVEFSTHPSTVKASLQDFYLAYAVLLPTFNGILIVPNRPYQSWKQNK